MEQPVPHLFSELLFELRFEVSILFSGEPLGRAIYIGRLRPVFLTRILIPSRILVELSIRHHSYFDNNIVIFRGG